MVKFKPRLIYKTDTKQLTYRQQFQQFRRRQFYCTQII